MEKKKKGHRALFYNYTRKDPKKKEKFKQKRKCELLYNSVNQFFRLYAYSPQKVIDTRRNGWISWGGGKPAGKKVSAKCTHSNEFDILARKPLGKIPKRGKSQSVRKRPIFLLQRIFRLRGNKKKKLLCWFLYVQYKDQQRIFDVLIFE